MSSPESRRIAGIGRVLVVVYAILALGATGRSFVQIAERFDQAPLAFSLSAVSAVVYIVATLALVLGARSRAWYRVAWVTISFELLGVLVIGTLSLVEPTWFPEATVWSFYGIGYVFVPLVLPFFGIWWLITHPPVGSAADADPETVAQNR